MNELLRPITSEEIAFYRENGFVHLKQIISPNAIQLLRKSLERAFERTDRNRGARTDMTKAANALEKETSDATKDKEKGAKEAWDKAKKAAEEAAKADEEEDEDDDMDDEEEEEADEKKEL